MGELSVLYYKCVLQVSQAQTANSSSSKPSTNTYKVAKRNVLKTLVTVFGCFVLCSSCNQFLFFVYFIGVSVNFNSAFYHFTVFATFSNCCLNPLIYAVRYNEFKTGFNKLMNKLLGRQTKVNAKSTVAGDTDTQLWALLLHLDLCYVL